MSSVKDSLEKAEFLVEDYYNPILVLNEFKSNFYDLIILDVQMPEINGLQLCREIRKRDKKAKVCFLTASETIFDTSNEFAEVYNFIKKPIGNNDLIRIVNGLLNTDE